MGDTFNPLARLQTKDGICAYLGGISHATYDNWQAKGIVPGPIIGTSRYDVRQHDAALDLQAGLTNKAAAELSPWEQWERDSARAA